MKSKIISIGSYTPNNIVTNQDLEKRVDTTDEWIVSRTGIKERPIADDSQATSDLAYEAAKIAVVEFLKKLLRFIFQSHLIILIFICPILCFADQLEQQKRFLKIVYSVYLFFSFPLWNPDICCT